MTGLLDCLSTPALPDHKSPWQMTGLGAGVILRNSNGTALYDIRLIQMKAGVEDGHTSPSSFPTLH